MIVHVTCGPAKGCTSKLLGGGTVRGRVYTQKGRKKREVAVLWDHLVPARSTGGAVG